MMPAERVAMRQVREIIRLNPHSPDDALISATLTPIQI
jgi:hypothetical protein